MIVDNEIHVVHRWCQQYQYYTTSKRGRVNRPRNTTVDPIINIGSQQLTLSYELTPYLPIKGIAASLGRSVWFHHAHTTHLFSIIRSYLAKCTSVNTPLTGCYQTSFMLAGKAFIICISVCFCFTARLTHLFHSFLTHFLISRPIVIITLNIISR